MKNNTTLAAIQMVSTSDLDLNLESAARLMQKAVGEGAKLILLPENFALMAGAAKLKQLADDSHQQNGKIHRFLKAQSTGLSVWIIAGSVPWREPGNVKPFSRSFVYNPEGQEVGFYDKIHLFDAIVGDEQGQYHESDSYAPGVSAQVVDTDVGRLGLSICFDLRFPDLYQNLAKQGAEIIVVPAAFTWKTGKAHWETLLRARAIETQSYVVAANQSGVHWDGRKTWGHSMIIDPWGKIIDLCVYGEGVVTAEVGNALMTKVREDIPLNSIR